MPPRAQWLLRLNAVPYLNPKQALGLIEEIGPERLAEADVARWSTVADVSIGRASRMKRIALAFDVEAELRCAAALDVQVLPYGEQGYPELLASLPDAPLALYAWGSLSVRPGVAVVGTRAPTSYGRRVARRLSADLARRGIAVVSGLARGIDAEAHDAALAAGGATWAVLGSGLGALYPPENRDLAGRIAAQGGCVVSEYPISVSPRPSFFPRRNRIIAGLSWATVVVEGRIDSGALVTARKAAEYGREVLAVPGPADSPLSEAPHRLLRDGARLAASIEDVVSALPPEFAARSTPPPAACLPSILGREEAQILRHIGGDSLSLEELVQITGLDMARLSLIMFGLEIKELVCAVPGQRYVKKNIV